MPIGPDTDRQGMSRSDRQQLEDDLHSGEAIEMTPNWARMHNYFSKAGGPKPGDKGHEDWEAGKADVHRYMHSNTYTKQAADPDHEQHFPGHEQWKQDNPL